MNRYDNYKLIDREFDDDYDYDDQEEDDCEHEWEYVIGEGRYCTCCGADGNA